MRTNKVKVDFLEESSGVRSSMRLMSLIALISSIVFGGITISRDADETTRDRGVYITFGFLLAAFAPKALQKFAEHLPLEEFVEETSDELHRDTEDIRILKEQNATLERQLAELQQQLVLPPSAPEGSHLESRSGESDGMRF